MTKDEALKMALEALRNYMSETKRVNAIVAIRQALEQPEREWVGLTDDEEIFDLADHYGEFKYGDAQGHKRIGFARAIEAKLKEKNG